jgi:hypothetical protein
MLGTYIIEPIDSKTLDRAYPLAKAVIPTLPQHEWRQLCQSGDFLTARPETIGEGEAIVTARNAKGYVKGLCVYAIRRHATYGRLVDVPLFVAASAADGEGVALELLNFLCAKCDAFVCSGIRFWAMDPEAWGRRLKPDHIARSDHGLFMPALASAAEIEKALCARGVGLRESMDRLSR